MKYTRRSPYIVFKRIDKNKYKVENYLYSEVYYADCRTAYFLKHLDGRHDPYDLLPDCSEEDIRQLMSKLEAYDLLAPKKELLKLGLGSCIYPLIYCYPGKVQKRIAKMLNIVLMMSFLPMLTAGIYLQSQGYASVHMKNMNELYLAIIIGAVTGAVPHELSHAFAGLAYNGCLSEFGVGIQKFLPMGYTMLDDSNVKSRLQKGQIYAAGIENNLLLYGVFMCIASVGIVNPSVMKLCGIINLVMAIINALPLDGLDGVKILSIAAGKEDVLKYAKELIRNRKKNIGKPFGNARYVAAIIASYVLIGAQVLLPMMLVCDGISLVVLMLL